MENNILQSSLLGKPLNSKEAYNIVGAGIAGLMLGYHLKKKGVKFKIYEKSHRTGGILGSQKSELGLVEKSATSFRWSQPMQDMCEDLGLRLIASSSSARKKYFFVNNEIDRFPISFWEAAQVFWNIVVKKSKNIETIEDFGNTFFTQKTTDSVIEPAMFGVYAGKKTELNFAAVLPDLADKIGKNGRLGLGLVFNTLRNQQKEVPDRFKGAVGFKNGMQELVNKLTEFLSDNIELQSDLSVNDLQNEPTIFTLPAYAAANFFEGNMALNLKKVYYAKMISATIYVKKSSVPKLKPGFGCLVAQSEGLHIAGLIYNNYTFPTRGVSNLLQSITVLIRDFDGSLFLKNDSDIYDIIKKELGIILGFTGSFLDKKMFRWEKGIPIYNTDLFNAWKVFDELLNKEYANYRLFANYTGQISLRGMCNHAKLACAHL